VVPLRQLITLSSKFIVKTKLKKVNNVYILPPGFILNYTGVKIIKYCDGKHNIKDIVTLISDEFDEGNATIKKDVMEFIRKLLVLSVLKEI
jgi:methyltransferase-like protein